MEEVRGLPPLWLLADMIMQNLREEVAMDVDDDEDGTQQPRQVQDYGIEVDFDSLDDDDREVCAHRPPLRHCILIAVLRTGRPRPSLSLTRK